MNKARGFGYAQCSCGFAVQIDPGRSYQSRSHRNPFTGRECSRNERNWKRPSDFAHEFRTDALAVRIDLPIPLPEEIEEGPERTEFRENVLRTLSEASRLALAKSLGVDEREIGSSCRWIADRPEIVLFDGVSGGAGYVTSFHRQKSPRYLIERTKEILTCDHCSSGCGHCLYSYGNQRHWDSFLREEALSFLDGLQIDEEDPRGAVEAGSQYLTPSEVETTLAGATEVFLMAERLGDFRGLQSDAGDGALNLDLMFPGWTLIKGYLESGKKITIACPMPAFNELSDPTCPLSLFMAERVLPYARDGKLRFVATTPFKVAAGPRLAMRGGDSALNISDIDRPILEMLYSVDGGRLKVGAKPPDELWTEESSSLPPAFLERKNEIYYKEYAPRKPRNLKSDFAFLKDRKAKRICIIDPYLNVSEESVSAFHKLIKLWTEDLGMQGPENIEVRVREADGRSDDEFRARGAQEIKVFLKEHFPHLEDHRIHISSFHYNERFHDRKIEIDLLESTDSAGPVRRRRRVSSETQLEKIRVTLTAGVRNLMDKRLECAIVRRKLLNL